MAIPFLLLYHYFSFSTLPHGKNFNGLLKAVPLLIKSHDSLSSHLDRIIAANDVCTIAPLLTPQKCIFLQNEDRTLWKLGTLPPGLITFYNLTYPLDRSWHVLGLGYDSALNQTEIDNAAVIHYNGNYKPWLDLAFPKYKSYWSRYVMFNNSYLNLCNISE